MSNENQPKNEATRATIGGEKIENKEVNLLDKSFEIPVYQRLYEWEKEQIETLLDDMKKACELDKQNELVKDKKEYFIGTVTTSIKANKDGRDNKNDETNKIYMLIDGQQRLTTLWFIGFYLASKNCPNWKEFVIRGENLRIAMSIRDNEQNSLTNLAKKIVDDKHKFEQDKDGKVNLFKELQNIHQNIINAFKCIESWFNENFSKDDNKKEIDFERLNCFANFIYTKACFVFVTLAQNTDLNRFFVRMNNRGKQLEKHEILKARILGEIRKVYDKNNKLKQDESDEIWKKYAKIWDLCSDMDKYIFQSASDRSILKSKSQNENSAESSNNNDSLVKIADIVEKYKIPEANKSKEKDSPSKVESIVDFPTFLLHCYKLWVAKKCNNKEILQKISITKDNLLEIMWDNQIVKGKKKELIIDDNFTFDSKSNAKQNCKEFIIDMLRYRVLFDYFVIKNTLGDDGFAIMRFYESNGSYQPKAKSFENLTMIQNYLRVARQGEKQNYHHWLTPFLRFLSENNFLDCKSQEISNNQNTQKKKKIGFFQSKAENLVENLKVDSSNKENEAKCVEFLQKLDTKLAIEQLPKESSKNGNENTLLPTSNEILRDLDSVNHFEVDKKFSENDQWSFLKYGNEIRYWFYRLEYYLWKNGVKNDDNPKIGGKNFSEIRKNFYFRNLNSVEHIHPQSKDDWSNDNGVKEIDKFGNLALLSVGFNSSLNDNAGQEKYTKLLAKVQKDEVESLKLWLVYASHYNKEKESWEWDKDKAKEHQNQMIDILIKSLNFKENK